MCEACPCGRVICGLAERVEIRCDIASLPLGHAEVGHGGLRLDGLRVANPLYQGRRRVRHFAGDENTTREIGERRSDHPARGSDPRNRVARSTTESLNSCFPAIRIASGDLVARLPGRVGISGCTCTVPTMTCWKEACEEYGGKKGPRFPRDVPIIFTSHHAPLV